MRAPWQLGVETAAEGVGGSNDVVAACKAMAAPMKVEELDPRTLITVQDAAGAPRSWHA